MRKAGHELAPIRDEIAQMVQPGVTTLELDRVAERRIREVGATPAFLGYHGFPGTICASINEEVVHGIPSDGRVLKEGDIVSIDIGLVHYGFVADSAVTVAVGAVSPEVQKLLDVTESALQSGIAAFQSGNRLTDISAAIQQEVEAHNFAVVREYTGHGIGRKMHEDPRILNYGEPGKGMRLRPGMVFAMEPMVNVGDWKTEVLEDKWTVVTADRKPSAHFEHTVALTEDGPEILTKV